MSKAKLNDSARTKSDNSALFISCSSGYYTMFILHIKSAYIVIRACIPPPPP